MKRFKILPAIILMISGYSVFGQSYKSQVWHIDGYKITIDTIPAELYLAHQYDDKPTCYQKSVNICQDLNNYDAQHLILFLDNHKRKLVKLEIDHNDMFMSWYYTLGAKIDTLHTYVSDGVANEAAWINLVDAQTGKERTLAPCWDYTIHYTDAQLFAFTEVPFATDSNYTFGIYNITADSIIKSWEMTLKIPQTVSVPIPISKDEHVNRVWVRTNEIYYTGELEDKPTKYYSLSWVKENHRPKALR